MGARRDDLLEEIKQRATDARSDRNPSDSREESIARARAAVEASRARIPAATCVAEAADQAPSHPPDEQQGLAEALASLRAGEGRTVDQVRTTISSRLRR